MKVSVAVLTYNHREYIGQALRSTLDQRTDFEFEVVVADDLSTDGTSEVVQRLADEDSRIRVLPRRRRLGRPHNFLDLLRNTHGDYVAFLDGDDYWSSPDKLQLQADLLDSHPAHSLVFHPVVMRWTDTGREELYAPPITKASYDLAEILEDHFPHPNSVMFRSDTVDIIPDWFYRMSEGGLPIIVLRGLEGSFGYLDKAMSLYRIHRRGAFSSLDSVSLLQNRLADFAVLRQTLDQSLHPAIDRATQRCRSRLALFQLRDNECRAARRTALAFLRHSPPFGGERAGGLRAFARMAATATAPSLYRRLRGVGDKHDSDPVK